jgi:hypothetical protein
VDLLGRGVLDGDRLSLPGLPLADGCIRNERDEFEKIGSGLLVSS